MTLRHVPSLISYSVNLMFVIVPLNAMSHVIPFVFLPGKEKAQKRSHSHWFIESDTKVYLLNSYTEFDLLVDNRAVTFFSFFLQVLVRMKSNQKHFQPSQGQVYEPLP